MLNLVNFILSITAVLEGTAAEDRTCSVCDKVFTRPRKRKFHELNIHGITRCSEAKKLKCPIICDKCSLTFQTLPELRAHQSEKHKNANDAVCHEFNSENGMTCLHLKYLKVIIIQLGYIGNPI